MPTRMHLIAGLVATLAIATFFVSSVLVEIFGDHETVARLKALILMPGLLILIPALAVTGASGFVLAKTRKGRLVDEKKKRMPFIAANGLLVLIPCAIVLDRWASAGVLDTSFYVVQGIEFLAGAVNLTLMGMNIRDGMSMSGRTRATPAVAL